MMRVLMLLIVALILVSCSRNMHKAKIVLLPDTQYYAEKYPAVLDSQINWILRNSNDINLVMQQGDLTQNNNETEWTIVQEDFNRLNDKVPYVLAAGNHDMGSAHGKFADVRNTDLFNRYFPVSTMSKLPAFQGVYENGKMENSYYTLATGRVKWLILSLEFGPRNSVVEWAGNIISQYPAHTVIINTHSYMYSDSTRQGPGDKWRAQNYGIGKDTGANAVNDGEQLWDKLVSKYPNIRFVFSGHILNSGVGTLISLNDYGNYVYQMLANYQSETGNPNGGNGWLRILDMDFKKKTLKVTTYSPYLNEFRTDSTHTFLVRNVLFEASGPGK